MLHGLQRVGLSYQKIFPLMLCRKEDRKESRAQFSDLVDQWPDAQEAMHP